MADVINLMGGAISTRAGVPNPKVIKALEEALEMAKAGALQSIVATGFTDDHRRLTVWADYHENIIEMYGALCWLPVEYVNRTTAGAEGDDDGEG